ncbi:putative HAF family extracellular repeat protein [Actinokineospora baliensis]|uniref:hypothetical protein n=1 Tax=Actinokineospora baliensis TaxID=547056 RepID=UPI001958819C|nr:hypothetical protein [Actinokineospora baliensis]MBM7774408.1 putative HAF family extracellular repeat protein [Actinokineospora baliensis]
MTAGAAEAAAGTRAWQAVELAPASGDWGSSATDIDEQGIAVGYSSGEASLEAHRAVRWDRDGRAVDLGTLGGERAAANAIGPRGVVVGHSQTADGQWRATRWGSRGATDLGVLPGATDSVATDIGADGTIAGSSGTAQRRLAVRWNSGRITALDAVPGSDIHWVVGVNDVGIVYGGASSPTGTQAVVWNYAGRATVLRSLGGNNDIITDMNRSGVAIGQSNGRPVRWGCDGTVTELATPRGKGFAAGITDDGAVAGRAEVADFTQHAVKWDQQGAITDLGPLPGSLHSVAADLNRSGTVIGWGGEGSASWAMVWAGNAETLPALAGTRDSRATAITDSGYVLGEAAVVSGVPRAVLWR